ncbi:MAG: ABC transporter permease [Bacteroidaceae bacterium]|nr:ABC transporter permease [Bacteroidaceae bacterium]
MNMELFIAKRLFGTRKNGRRISRPAVTIAQWGVAVGIAVMTISLCIVIGFKHNVRDKIVGFGSHIQIQNYQSSPTGELPTTMNTDDIADIFATEGVQHVQKYIYKPGLVSVGNEFEGVVLKGIGSDYNNTFIQEHIVEGELPIFTDSAATNKIVLSRLLTQKLRVKLGDKIDIYFMQDGIKARRMTLAAIYETHLSEMDAMLALTDIYTMRRLNAWSSDKASGIEISVNEFTQKEDVRYALIDKVTEIANRNEETLFIRTIEEMNPHMFAWLEILDSTVWIILVLVLGIAGFTTISGLLILILEKTNMIGILKAIGAKNRSIRKIFLYYAMFIIGRGIILGNVIGILLCLIQAQTGIVKLDPEMYYMQHVPIEFTWWLIPMNILMFIVSIAILVIPSMLISHIEPTKAIKFE